jgi:hypothetical protein
LHSQIHNVSHASHVLFLLVKHDVADATEPFEVNQEVVDVGGIVGGDGQNVGKNPEPVTRRNERITQVLTRVLTNQSQEQATHLSSM